MDRNRILLGQNTGLSWSEYGVREGQAVFYFHGTPGSSFEPQLADEIARQFNIHLIAPDRPGYGYSEPQPNFRLLDWPPVISKLANQLSISSFSVLGFSGGGAYALACAHQIPNRIDRISLVGSIAPFQSIAMQEHINQGFKPLYELAATDYSVALEQISQLASSPDTLLDVIENPASLPDQKLFIDAEFRSSYLNSLKHATQNSANGITCDLRNFAEPWGFDITEIQHHIEIWHGKDDNYVGFPIAKYLSKSIPNTTDHFLDEFGHFINLDLWRTLINPDAVNGMN